MKKTGIVTATLMAALAAAPQAAHARIKLVALPDREETVVRLDHPQATLVEEERVLSLQEGSNRIDFSWKGVQIDPNSIRLAVLDHPDKVKLINVSYPPNEAALVWEITSPKGQKEKVRISYLLSQIDRVVTYESTSDAKEEKLDLDSFMVLRNFSGEDFIRALFCLDYGKAFEKAIQSGETKRMLFLEAKGLKIRKRFTFDAGRMAWEPAKEAANVGIPVHYEIENSAENHLGKHALWGGKVRMFQRDSQGSTIFLGEDEAGFTPMGEKMKLYMGDSRDIVVTQRKVETQEVNIRWSDVQHNQPRRKILYDVEESMKVEIENFKDKEAVLTVLEPMPGEWEMKEKEQSHPHKVKDAHQIEFEIALPAKGKVTLTYKYLRKNIRG